MEELGSRAKLALAGVAVALVAALGASTAQARPSSAAMDGRPNILVVMTDDMSAADLKLMPNVRKLLAKKGTTFADAVDSFPLCCPARATFITGQYAHNHGVKGNFAPYGWYGMKDRKNILPAWLDDAGYRTALIGKWLNGYGALDAHGEIPNGFDTWRGLLDVSAYDYSNFVMNMDGKLKAWGDKEFARKLVEFALIEVDDQPDTPGVDPRPARGALRAAPVHLLGRPDDRGLLARRDRKDHRGPGKKEGKKRKPFFIWWTPAAPHREDVATTLMGRTGPDPRPAPRYEEKSKGYTLPRPPSFNEADTTDKSANFQAKAPPLTDEQIAQLQLDYEGRAGSMLAVDDHVGELVKTLKRTDQLRNTMIVFLSDNGWLQGEHRVPGDKFLPYEESLRVPLVIRGPGVPKNQTVHGQVSNIDFAPTLLDAADAKSGRKMDGVSLLPTIANPSKRPKRVLEIEALEPLFANPDIPANGWDRPYTGVRTDRYTYVVWTDTGELELYDRKTDPYELDNVAGDPAYASVEADLAAKLKLLADCAGKACNVRP